MCRLGMLSAIGSSVRQDDASQEIQSLYHLRLSAAPFVPLSEPVGGWRWPRDRLLSDDLILSGCGRSKLAKQWLHRIEIIAI